MALLFCEPWTRWLSVFLGCCLLFIANFTIVAPASSAEKLSVTQRQVSAGVPRSFPPYYQLDEAGRPTGFGIAVMDEVAKRANLKVTYRIAETGENFKALLAGDVDVIPNIGITDFRKQHVAFTTPMETFVVSLFTRDNTKDIESIADMDGRPIAVVAGNAAHRFLKKRPNIQIKVFPLFTDALFALLSAKVDAFAYPKAVAWQLAREARVDNQIKVVSGPLLEIKRAMAVRNDNKELLAVLDRAVEGFVASPEYQAIYVTWFGKPNPFWTVSRVAWSMGVATIVLLVIMGIWRYYSIVRLNQALKQSEQYLRSFTDNAPALVSLKDMNGRYLLINSEYTKQFGFSPGNVTGEYTKNLFPEDVTKAFAIQEHNVADSKKVITQEQIVPHDGEERVHLCTKFPVFNDQGEVSAIGTISTDITEHKQADEARHAALIDAEQANQAKSEFLATMSHEFRTPLNAILGFSEMLRSQYFGPLGAENYKNYANDIHNSGEQMLELINDILDISALEAGKRQMMSEAVDLEALLGDCIRSFEHQAANAEVSLSMDFSEGLPALNTDKRSINQIVLNLISNAVKFTERNGAITVSALVVDNNLTIKISDTGIGIASDKLPKITEPFSQGRSDPHLAQHGTGLGLSIVRSLVNAIGAELNIESEVGTGTTVSVTFPTEEQKIK